MYCIDQKLFYVESWGLLMIALILQSLLQELSHVRKLVEKLLY